MEKKESQVKGKVVFLASEKEDLSLGKCLVFLLDIFCTIAAYVGGKVLLIAALVFLPVVIISLIVTIVFIQKSVRNKTFEILSLFSLPIIIAFIIGSSVSSIQNQRTKKNLLEAQKYVEQYYEQNGSFPGNNDPYLQELDVQIQGSKFFGNYLKAQEYTQQYYNQYGKLPDKDDPYLQELDSDIFGEDNYYELHANGARIRRGDDHVYFYPQP